MTRVDLPLLLLLLLLALGAGRDVAISFGRGRRGFSAETSRFRPISFQVVTTAPAQIGSDRCGKSQTCLLAMNHVISSAHDHQQPELRRCVGQGLGSAGAVVRMAQAQSHLARHPA